MSIDNWWTTMILVRPDDETDPDWEAGVKFLESIDIDDEKLQALATEDEGLAKDTRMEPEEYARQELISAARMIQGCYENRAMRADWEVRVIPDMVELHILYDNAEDPTGLWPEVNLLEDYATGWFARVGFSTATSRDFEAKK